MTRLNPNSNIYESLSDNSGHKFSNILANKSEISNTSKIMLCHGFGYDKTENYCAITNLQVSVIKCSKQKEKRPSIKQEIQYQTELMSKFTFKNN